MNWHLILGLIAGGALVLWLYITVKNQPNAFNKKNLSQSFSTMGVLAILLIIFIAACVVLLKKH